jgi:hypothetical protein
VDPIWAVAPQERTVQRVKYKLPTNQSTIVVTKVTGQGRC